MPARNSRKNYLENGYYHLYNRGIDKQLIFKDDQDYNVFLKYLKEYLSPKDEISLQNQLNNPLTTWKEKDRILKLLRLNNFSEEISLLAYSLMPNHFHFLIKQSSYNAIYHFINSLGTRYTMYFNRKHKRIGHLYQGVYKAVLVETEEQLLHLTRYIHKQALASQGQALRIQQPSSLPEYLEQKSTGWIKSQEILNYFSKTNPKISYSSFVIANEDLTFVHNLLIESIESSLARPGLAKNQ